jgi:SAM-dependent methyltransferase
MPAGHADDKAVALWNESWGERTNSVSELSKSDEIFQAISGYIERDSAVLEAGCGNGKWVLGLAGLGYDVVGMDFSKVGLRNISNRTDSVRLAAGDVRELPFRTGIFNAILSWGVLEHLEEGPEKAIVESLHCLTRTGKLLITIPRLSPSRCVNPLVFFRRLISASNLARRMLGREEKCFFQYEYGSVSFARLLQDGGFKILRSKPVGAEFGITDDMKPFSMPFLLLFRRLAGVPVLKCVIDWFFGAFTLYICSGAQ